MWARRLHPVWLAATFFAPCLTAPAQTPQDRTAAYLELYKKESDPVRRAKLLPHLGEAQLDEVERLADAGDYIESGKKLEEYRDEVKGTFQGLKATGVDAERRPSGFKELQIHLRKALAEIDGVIRKIPEGPRVPFQLARQDVVQVNAELINMLFPRQPGKRPKEKHEE